MDKFQFEGPFNVFTESHVIVFMRDVGTSSTP